MILIWVMLGINQYINNYRTYVSSDIIKRIMRDYFGYDVKVRYPTSLINNIDVHEYHRY